MKVNFFENSVRSKSAKIISFIAGIFSLLIPIIPMLNTNIKWWIYLIILIMILLIFVIIYMSVFLYYKVCKCVKIRIHGNKVNIHFGDIFKEEGNKVINFTEYFDTDISDTDIISPESLNYFLIKDHLTAAEIDESLSNDLMLKKEQTKFLNRNKGKQQKYKLGTIHSMPHYFLVAFSQISEKYEAEFKTMNDYYGCLINMWRNLNVKYNGADLCIPLLGGGMTRHREKTDMTKQELLENMLNSLIISNSVFKNCTINIILYPGKGNDDYKEYNFARIKYLFS